MRRLLVSSAVMITACTLTSTPTGDTEQNQRPKRVEYRIIVDSEEEQTTRQSAPQEKQKQKQRKVAYYVENPCARIDTGDMRKDILAKMECLMELP